MPAIRVHASRRFGRSMTPVILFLAGFVVLLLVVAHYYLIPALKLSKTADPEARKLMSAQAMLIMTLMLFILLMGLLITFRIGRFFRPHSAPRPKPTEYVDAWQEAARRLKVPEEDQDE